MQNLKTTLPYLSGFDLQGRQFVFIGGVCTPEDEAQQEYILTNYKQVSLASKEDGGPGSIQELKDFQATQSMAALDQSANVSTSDTGKIKPANTMTMAAIAAGVTPQMPTIKVPSNKE